ncbi:hypothetical protein R3P38DRAFT_2791988 [Favolaschia claudopus]|uniref:Uncharacterized protein n=1 Tax=Favolaschia claudopus TaxID=2862362 RepID=A0AAW0AER9_9AGAR
MRMVKARRAAARRSHHRLQETRSVPLRGRGLPAGGKIPRHLDAKTENRLEDGGLTANSTENKLEERAGNEEGEGRESGWWWWYEVKEVGLLTVFQIAMGKE